jgi:arylsulfatase A-like enzyme
MKDVVLVTADSVRRDLVDAMPFVDGHEVLTGVTAGHYTRPSLAALLSSRLRAAVQSTVVGPTLADALEAAGYTTIGLVPTAQADPTFGFDAGFDHYDNYMAGGGKNPARNRRSWLREYLGSFDLVRQVYRRIYPMAANMADLPDDGAVVDEAIERFNAAEPPRFLWLHQMGSHRPYGTGEDAVPGELDRKAEASGGRHWFGSSDVTDEERALILGRYRDALGRVDERVERLLGGIDVKDPIFAFTADHGEEFGEEGYYYHQGYRRRVPDSIVRVPVVLRGVETVGDRCSLLDLAPTLAGAAGVDVPDPWHGNDLRERETEATLTVAPWRGTATVAWQDFEHRVVARNAEVSMTDADDEAVVDGADVPEDVEARLRDLGYSGAG